jgi:hypothetical protein
MPKDRGMTHTHRQLESPLPPVVTPWALRAWPPLLWQARDPSQVHFQHVDTRITFSGDPMSPPAGQTVWAAHAADGDAGMAWDWVQIARGVVAIADPMSVVTNLRIVSRAGEVMTAVESALFLNQWVHALPWQSEVQRALRWN